MTSFCLLFNHCVKYKISHETNVRFLDISGMFKILKCHNGFFCSKNLIFILLSVFDSLYHWNSNLDWLWKILYCI